MSILFDIRAPSSSYVWANGDRCLLAELGLQPLHSQASPWVPPGYYPVTYDEALPDRLGT